MRWSRYRTTTIFSAIAVVFLHVGHAVAHHAEATFDHSKILFVTGTIREFLLANPHTLIYLGVTDSSGRTDVIVFQGGPAVVMTRNGWSRDSLKVGDKVRIDYTPRRDQKPGGMVITATRDGGEKFTWRPLS